MSVLLKNLYVNTVLVVLYKVMNDSHPSLPEMQICHKKTKLKGLRPCLGLFVSVIPHKTDSIEDHLRGKEREERAKSLPSIGGQGAEKSRTIEVMNTSKSRVSREHK